MKKLIITLLLTGCAFAGTYAQNEIVVDPNASVRTIATGFTQIKVSHSIKLVLSQSEEVSLAVSAEDDKYKSYIKTEVSGNTLRISLDNDHWSGSKNRRFTVYLSFKDLEKLEISGAAQVLVAGTLKLSNLGVEMSGATVLNAKMEVQNLTLNMSGATKSRVSGNAGTANIECSGASDISAYGLQIQNCSASASGASDMQLQVIKSLNATASGASRIYYKGEPSTNIKKSGVSKIENRL